MFIKKLIIFLILSLTFAIADQINVSTAGSDTNGDGSSGSPFKTIQYAIEHANTSSGDTILVAVGTYAENINFRGKDIVIGSLTLTTSDKSYVSQTIIDGGSPSNPDSASVVTFIGGETSAAKLVGFTLQNGNGLMINNRRYGGGIYTISSSPTLKHLSVKNNANFTGTTFLYGAGIYFGKHSDAILDSSEISNNGESNVGNGGGIHINMNSDVTFDGVLVKNNKAKFGGGIFLPVKLSNANSVFRRVEIISNEALHGGGIYVGGKSTGLLKMYNSKVANNIATGNGGGFYITRSTNEIELYDILITGNSAVTKGGGIYVYDAKPRIERSLFEGNASKNGGAIYVDRPNAELNLINGVLYNNTATERGSAIFSYYQSTVNIYHTTISNNTAGLDATIRPDYGSKIYFYNSVLWNNAATNQIAFGGTQNTAGRFEAKNSIIQGLNSIQISDNIDTVDTDNSNFETDPIFSNAVLNDYTLQNYSPAIGYGTNDTSYSPASIPVSLDFNSNSRPTGSNPDIGAHENSLDSPANSQPLLNKNISDLSVDEDSGERTVSFTGVADGDFHANQTLTVIATSNNTSLIPNPTVTYTSPDTSGTITFTPVPDMIGTANLTLIVNDNGGSSNGGIDTVSASFKVTVNPIVPDSFKPTQTNIGGIVQGTARLNGNPASAGDWIAALDTNEKVVGSAPLVNLVDDVRFGVGSSNFILYGDDPTTSDMDEGMNPGEDFTLKIWDASTNQIFVQADNSGKKISHSGWEGTNFIPITGYDNPDALFNFVYNTDPIIQKCNVTELNEDQKYEFTLSDFQYSDNDSISNNNLTLIINPGSNYTVSGDTITPASNYSGSIQVGFQLDDGFSSSTVFNADINVLAVDDPPEVKNKINDITVDEDAANTAIDLSATFTDIDNPDSEIAKAIKGNTPSGKIVASISNDILTLDYQDNHNGIVAITLTGTSNGLTVDTSFTVTINAVNDVAAATSQTVNADEDKDKKITLAGTDVDGDTLTFKITTLPLNGYLFQTSDGTTKGDTIKSVPTTVSDGSHRVIYLSAQDGNGDGHGNFGFKINDGTTDSEEATVTVNVAPVDDKITGTAQIVTVNEDTDITITLAGNDADGRTLSFRVTLMPANGYLYQTSDGTTKGDMITSVPTTVTDGSHRVIYLSAQDGNGDGYGHFGFKIYAGNSASSEATVTVNVTPINDVAAATSQTVSADEDIDKTITLSGTDVDGDTLTFKITTLPLNGYLFQTSDGTTKGDTIKSVPTNVTDGSHRVIYLSAKDGNGDDYGNFGFKINDGTTDSEEATVTVNVINKNDLPIGTAQTISADEDIDKTITLSGADVDGDSLTYKITTLPANGYLFQTSDGTTKGDTIKSVTTNVTDGSHRVIYVSAQDGNGDGHGNFGFKINDGTTDSEEATVTVNVTPINDVVAATSQTISADEDIDKTIILGATDVDGDSLTYKITTLPANGYLFQTSDGTTKGDTIKSVPTNVTDGSHRVIYLSAKDGHGVNYGNFGFKVNDGTSDSEEATVTVNVINKNDLPIGMAQTISADEDIDKTITLSGTDVDGDTLTFKITTLPLNGYLFQTSDGTTKGDTIKSVPTNISDGSHRVIYISAKDGNGDGHGNFGFKIKDGTTDSEEATVTVNVTPINDVVAATSQTISADEDIDKTITLSGTDVDGDSLSYKITTLPANGYLFQTSDETTKGDTIKSVPTTVTDGSHRVIYISAKDGNGDGHGNFGFKVNDGTADSEEATVTVNVINKNDLPIGTAQTISADQDTDKTITLAGTDADGDPLSYKITTLPLNGYLFQTSDGTTRGDTIKSVPTTVTDGSHRVIYISAQNGSGDGHGNFGFKVNDGTTDSEEATVTLNVALVDDKLLATAQTVTGGEDTDLPIALAGTDSDGRSFSFKITALPANGFLFQTSDGTTRGDTIKSVPTTVTDGSHRVIYLSAQDGNGDGHGNFGFKIYAGNSASSEATVTVNVTPINDVAAATSQTVSADEDTDKKITLAGTDVDGDSLSFKITTLPLNGYLFQTSDGTTKGNMITSVPTNVTDGSHRVIYLSAQDGNGDGHGNFGFKVNDGTADSDEATVTVNVAPVDDKLTATAQSVTVNEDTDITITLSGTDADGNTLTFKITTLPLNGYLFQTIDGTTKGDTIKSVPTTVTDGSHRVIYLSAKDGNGDGHGNFGFKIYAGNSESSEATVTVNVTPINDVAAATSQTVSADEDTDKKITLAGTDVDGDSLTFKITTLPLNGYLFQTSDGTTKGNMITSVPTNVTDGSHRVIYLSAQDGNGDGHGNFGFKVNDETADSEEATVTVNVTPVDDKLTATAQSVTVNEDTDITITLSGTDADGNTLTFKITTLPLNGYLFQTGDGTTKGDTIKSVPTTVTDGSHRVIYLSAKDGNGDGHGNFGFKIYVGNSESSEVTVTVNVTPVDDKLTATAQSVTVNEDTDITITLAGNDVDGRTLSFRVTTLPLNGYLFQTIDGTTKGDTIKSVPTTVTDGSHRVIYLSAKDGNGDGHGNFGFKVNDETADSDETIVIVNVTKVNDIAAAISQIVNANEDLDKSITLSGTDADGDSLTYKITTLPANGYLFQTSDGTTRFDTITSIPTTILYANHQVIYISAKDENGVNYGNFGFKVNDGTTDSEEAIVTTNVLNVNDLPSAPVQTVSADEDIDKTITLAANDVDGDSLTYKITTLPLNGYLFQTSDGITRGDTIQSVPITVTDTSRVIYVSAQDGYGDSHGDFGFKANDGTADSEETIVTVNVAPKVENREAIPQTVIAVEDTDVNITLIGADADGDPLSYKITTLPLNGYLFQTSDGTTKGDTIKSVPTTISGPIHRVIYLSAKDGNGNGHGNFGFKVNDGTADGDEAIVTINVKAVNDPPTPITIISPADSSKIIITINNKDISKVVFDWTSSIDVEDNELTYIFEYELKMVNINNETINYYEGKDLLYPGLSITYSEILENLDHFLSAGAALTWSVDVTDGIDTVFSTDERVIFVIGKYAALAVDGVIIPEEYSLSQNYPNPFNPTTRIQYNLPKTGLVQISIYTLMGQKISTLVNRNMEAGRHNITWNGMDDLGNPAGAGVYLYQLRANQFVKTRKMVLLK